MTIHARKVINRKYARLRHGRMFRRFLRRQAVRLIPTGGGTAVTFDNTTNEVTSVNHGLEHGDGPIAFSNSGGSLPTGLVVYLSYWARRVSNNDFTLYPSEYDALHDTNIVTFSDDGTGTSLGHLSCQDEDIYNSLLSGNTADQVRAMTSSDDL